MPLEQLKQDFLMINKTIYFGEHQYLREQTNNATGIESFITSTERALQLLKEE